MSRPLLVSLTPFATDPPHMGGQIVIRAANLALSQMGWQVEQFSLGVRRQDLAYVGRRRVLEVAPGYREHRATHPVLVAAFVEAASRHAAHIEAGTWLDRVGWPDLQAALGRADAVVCEQPWPYAPRLLAQRRAPMFLASQNVEASLADDTRRSQICALERRSLHGADHVGAITPEDREALIAGYGLDPDRISVVPRGIDVAPVAGVSPEERREKRASLGVGDGELLAVFSGSLHGPNHEAALQVQALAGWCGAPWRFLVAGSVARVLPPNALDKVLVRTGDPRSWLAVADVALNPMLGGSGLNVKMIEYMAMGLPILTTPFGARGFSRQGEEAFRVAPLDQWSEHLALLAVDPSLRARLGAAGQRQAVQRYSATATARAVTDLIGRLSPTPAPTIDLMLPVQRSRVRA